MSAPRTNIETQKRRHIGPIVGITLAVVFGVGLILYWLAEEAAYGTGPQGAETQIDGRTGDPVAGEPEIPPGAPGPESPAPQPSPDAPAPAPEVPPATPEAPQPTAPEPEVPAPAETPVQPPANN